LKIAVIGSGIVGITTAYELSLDGHEVTVFDRHSTAAEACSFANGSLIAPGWNADFSARSHRLGALMPWASGAGALPLSRWPSGSEWGWMWQWLRAGRADRQADQQRHLYHLSCYSHERLLSLTASQRLDYDRSDKLLLLWRSEQDQANAQTTLQTLAQLGWKHRVLTALEARQCEPALNTQTRLHAALEITGLASANCRQFALLLKAEAQKLGCRFAWGTTVHGMSVVSGSPVRVEVRHAPSRTPASALSSTGFDAAVVCAGAAGAALLRPLGLRLPLLRVFAHSISATVREPLDAPVSAVLDVRQQVSIARLGQRVRVAGGQHLGPAGASAREHKALHNKLYRVLSDWFPGAASLSGAHATVQTWQGEQGCLPDGLPVLGETRLPGLWLNLGHGHSGWSTACGSARALADQIGQRAPDIDLTGHSPARFGL
jgi:D-amino-acid dehydrogenase